MGYMSKLRQMHQDVSLIILFVTKSKSQFPDFGVMGTMVGPLPILATKGLSATAIELRARLILEPARRARRRQGRSALCAKAPRRRVFGRTVWAAHRVPPGVTRSSSTIRERRGVRSRRSSASRRSGALVQGLVRHGADARAALAEVLGRAPMMFRVRDRPSTRPL